MVYEIKFENNGCAYIQNAHDKADNKVPYDLWTEMESCGFTNMRVACYDGYENSLEIH